MKGKEGKRKGGEEKNTQMHDLNSRPVALQPMYMS